MSIPEQAWPLSFAERYRRAGHWTGATFPALLRELAQTHGERTAVVGGDRRWTYAELLRRAERAAAGFAGLGLRPGERVIVQLPNRAEFVSAVFGIFRAGLIPVFALPAHRLTEIAHFAERSQAAAFLTVDQHDGFDYHSLAREVMARSPTMRHCIIVGDAEEFAESDTLDGDPRLLPVGDPSPSSVAFLQISGGSTGLSKLIPRTHDDYIYSFRASAGICRLGPQSVYLAALPVAHNFPMSSPGIFGVLSAGGTVVMSPSPAPVTAFPLIERERVTITGLVPPLALLWMQAAPKTAHDLSSLEVLQVGGAKFIPEAARRVRPTLGCTLQQVFGMAEGLVNYTRLDDPDETIVETQGRPICADDEIMIVDDAGEPVAPGQPGQLLTRGPYTIRAYHAEPAANRRAFTPDGWYRTGDIVAMRPDGNLVVQGRATDHINRAGEKISAEEIEDHLVAHPQVFDAAVVSMPDPYLGERSCAFVIADGERPAAQALKAWMRGRNLADFKVPDQIVFVDAFETTAVGKISRKELRARLRDTLLSRDAMKAAS